MMVSDGVILCSYPLSFVAGTCYYYGNQNSQIKDHNHGPETLPAGATPRSNDAASAVFGRLCVQGQSGVCARCSRPAREPAASHSRSMAPWILTRCRPVVVQTAGRSSLWNHQCVGRDWCSGWTASTKTTFASGGRPFLRLS